MTAFAATLKLDVINQARSKLYAVGVLVAVLLGLSARLFVGMEHASIAVPILYFLGLGGTTYMFGASMVLLDKSQNTLQALRVTPLSTEHYIGSKLVTLVAFAATEGLIIHLVGFGAVSFSPGPLIAGVVSLGAMNALLGLGQVAPYESVLRFLVPGAVLVGSLTQWPFLGALQIGPAWLYYLLPTNAPFLMMLGAFEPLESWQWIYAIGVVVASLGVLWWWARRRFRRHVGLSS